MWGPLVDPESPFFHIPPYISAVLRGERPSRLYGADGGDRCYAPDAGRAIALLMTTPTLRHDTYNVSSGVPSTNRDFAAALESAITDEQAHYHGCGDVAAVVPQEVPVYTWNLAGYRVAHAPAGPNRHAFGGLSDAAFGMIPLAESGEDGRRPC
ncbi:hypothetical protein ACQP1P_19335 [Dactylosporangium sp. CA-052675]|uniref:hypothetical protein n=1 Tax=Dactylosporangium sp. CA-052675 TaxID=3239927 RepID=UPI003D8FE3C1